MNSANPSTASRTPSNRFPLVLTLTLVLSLLSCNTNKHLIQTQQHQTENHESRIENRESRIDSIATLVTETIWLPPDTLGRQYPLHTIRRETGQKTESLTNLTAQTRDTLFIDHHDSDTWTQEPAIANHESRIGNRESRIGNRESRLVWLPWIIIIIMILLAATIIFIRIYFVR